MKPISSDLRQRIIVCLQANEETQPEIAERFSVSLSFVEKLWHRFRETGNYEAKPYGGGRKRILAESEDLLRDEVKKQPNVSLAELSEQILEKTEVSTISLLTISNELQRLGLGRKKTLYASERDEERVQIARVEYQAQIALEILSRFKFIDEAVRW